MAYSSTRSSQGKMMINFCSKQELMVLPCVGKNKLNMSDGVLNILYFTPNVDYDRGKGTVKAEDVSSSSNCSKAEDQRIFQERMLWLIEEKSSERNGDREGWKLGTPHT